MDRINFARRETARVYSSSQCRQIIDGCASFSSYSIRHEGTLESEVCLVDDPAIAGQLLSVMRRVNDRWYGFTITGIETPRVRRYAEGMHCPRHLDCNGRGHNRKVSVSVQLTAPDDYDGGRMRIGDEGEADLEQGCATVFPSFHLHGIDPVTRGVRYALIAWATGPAFV